MLVYIVGSCSDETSSRVCCGQYGTLCHLPQVLSCIHCVFDYMYNIMLIYIYIPPKAAHFFFWKSDFLGCVVLLFLVVCMTLLASFFLLSLSLINMYMYMYIIVTRLHVLV